MTRRIILVAWLVAVWVALWERFSVANVAGGLVVGLVLVMAFPPRGRQHVTVRPLALLRFAAHFVVKLVEANAFMAWEVLTPVNRVNAAIVAVPLEDTHPGVVALVANAVSLTPGTLTIEVREDPTVLYVHVLHLRSVEAAREEVRTLDRLARAAFPTVPQPEADA